MSEKTSFATKMGKAMAGVGAGIAAVSGAVTPLSNHKPVHIAPVPAIHQRIRNVGNVGKTANEVLGAITDAKSNASQNKANGPSSVTAALTRGSTQSKTSGAASAALKGSSSHAGSKSSGGASKGGGQSR